MSKIAYSTFTGGKLRPLAEKFKGQPESVFWEKYSSEMLEFCRDLSPEKAAFQQMWWNAAYLTQYHNIRHYFVAPGVADFCVGSVKECSSDYLRDFPEPAAVATDKGGLLYQHSGISAMHGALLFHFPANEHIPSLLVMPEMTVRIRCHAGAQPQLYSVRFAACYNDGRGIIWGADGVLEDWQSAPRETRLVFGLSLYMDAFPDAIVPAADHSVHHLRHYKGEQRQIGRAPAMEHEERCAVRPHFRRGHFRVLHSPKFTHKRGQTIFITGTFVRGTAFDILDDAPPAKATR